MPLLGSAPTSLDALRLPPVRPRAGSREAVRRSLRDGGVKLAVVDDDPTGTQTVRDVPLVTRWDRDELAWGMAAAEPLFGILTNSRALPQARAVALNAEIGERLATVARELGVRLRAVSRSDSTLRGHFPAEPEALADGLARAGQPVDCILVCPAFPEAGRVTVNGTHLVRRGAGWLRAGETDYARDAAFGYRSSDLVEWVRERAGKETTVAAIAIEDVRLGGPDRVAECLLAARGRARYVVADAVEAADLEVLAHGVVLAEQEGLRLLCRTGPSFLAAFAGREPAAPLTAGEIAMPAGRGLVVVGSHTELTTAQLAEACAGHELEVVTLDVEELLAADLDARREIVTRTAARLRAVLADRDAALVTSRQVARAARGTASLAAIAAIADALVEVVRAVAADVPLDWLVAKGGITSHDMAARALGARRATVLGQLFPGQVSVWELGAGSVRTGLRYVVFPGNVGDRSALARALGRLKGAA